MKTQAKKLKDLTPSTVNLETPKKRKYRKRKNKLPKQVASTELQTGGEVHRIYGYSKDLASNSTIRPEPMTKMVEGEITQFTILQPCKADLFKKFGINNGSVIVKDTNIYNQLLAARLIRKFFPGVKREKIYFSDALETTTKIENLFKDDYNDIPLLPKFKNIEKFYVPILVGCCSLGLILIFSLTHYLTT